MKPNGHVRPGFVLLVTCCALTVACFDPYAYGSTILCWSSSISAVDIIRGNLNTLVGDCNLDGRPGDCAGDAFASHVCVNNAAPCGGGDAGGTGGVEGDNQLGYSPLILPACDVPLEPLIPPLLGFRDCAPAPASNQAWYWLMRPLGPGPLFIPFPIGYSDDVVRVIAPPCP